MASTNQLASLLQMCYSSLLIALVGIGFTVMPFAPVLSPVQTAQAATTGDVIISEVLANPTATNDVGEYIVLEDETSGSISLDGWTLSDGDGGSVAFSSGNTFDGNSTLKVCSDTSANTTGSDCDIENDLFRLSNSGNTTLTINNGATDIAQVSFSDPSEDSSNNPMTFDSQDNQVPNSSNNSGPVENDDNGETFQKIQEAIDDNDTDPGDEIKIETGSSYDGFETDKALTFVGAGKADTTIEGGVKVESGYDGSSSNHLAFKNLTLQGDAGASRTLNGGDATLAGLTIENVKFEGNGSTRFAIYSQKTEGSIKITGSKFIGYNGSNNGDSWGTIDLIANSNGFTEVTFTDNEFMDNTGWVNFDGLSNGGSAASSLTITGNNFENNSAGSASSAVLIAKNADNVDISGNTFTGNSNSKLFIYDQLNSPTDLISQNTFDNGGANAMQSSGVIYSDIQGAIDDPNTDDGDTIQVAAGTYNENVVINKALTLEGANEGTAGANGNSRGNESMITEGVEITTDDVTLDGFKISNNDVNGIKISNAPSNVLMKNNVVHDVGGGTAGPKGVGNGINMQFTDAFEKTSSNIRIVRNKVTGITTSDASGDADAIGIQLLPRGNDVKGLKIKNNTITGIKPGSAGGRAEARGISIDTQFTDTPGGTRGDSGQPTNLTIKHNQIDTLTSDFSRAITLFEDKKGSASNPNTKGDPTSNIGPKGFEIEKNTIENVTSSPDFPAESIFIGSYNDLGESHQVKFNNLLASVESFGTTDKSTLNAEKNWWGASNGPIEVDGNRDIIGNNGSGTAAIQKQSDIDVKPWLCDRFEKGEDIPQASQDGSCEQPGLGGDNTLRVCKLIVDSEGEIFDGSNTNSEFSLTINSATTSNSEGQYTTTFEFATTTTFTTPTTPNDDLFDVDNPNGDSAVDVQCKTVENLPDGNYAYSQENINPDGQWDVAQYNDGPDGTPNDLNDFAEYSDELFDDKPDNDNKRNNDSDGDIPLEDGETRALTIKNTSKKKTCELNPDKHLSVDSFNAASGTVSISNSSTECSYDVGIASYKGFNHQGGDTGDLDIGSQELHDHATGTISQQTNGDPGVKSFNIEVPSCSYQIDVFYGDLITDFSGGDRYNKGEYGDRKIDGTASHENTDNLCEQPEGPTTTIDAPTGTAESCSFTVSGEANADPEIGLNRVYVQLVNRDDNQRYGGTTIDLLNEGSSANWSVDYDANADSLPDGDYAAHVAVVDKNGDKGTAGWTDNFTLDCDDNGDGGESELLSCESDKIYHLKNKDNSSTLVNIDSSGDQETEGDYGSKFGTLAIAPDDKFYAVERGSNDLVTLNGDDTFTRQATTSLQRPVAAGFAPDGTMYVGDQENEGANKFYTVDTSSGDIDEVNGSNQPAIDGGDLVVNGNQEIVYVNNSGDVFRFDMSDNEWSELEVPNGQHNNLPGDYSSLSFNPSTGIYSALDKPNNDIDMFEINEKSGTGMTPEVDYFGSTNTDVEYGDGASCTPEPEDGTISGVKFEDEERDREYNDGDELLNDWRIAAYNDSMLHNSYDLDPSNPEGITTDTLATSSYYVVEVVGTWTNNDTREVDAEYFSDDDFNSSHDDFSNTTTTDARQLDVVIDNQNVNWGSYNENPHKYTIVQPGSGDTVDIEVFEEQQPWYSDNQGSLTVNVYEIPSQYIAQTGAGEAGNGEYLFTVPPGNYTVLENRNPEWIQTTPKDPSYADVTVEPGEDVTVNFGNDDLEDEGDDGEGDGEGEGESTTNEEGGGGGGVYSGPTPTPEAGTPQVLGEQDSDPDTGGGEVDLSDLLGDLADALKGLQQSFGKGGGAGTTEAQQDVAGVQAPTSPGLPNTGDGSFTAKH